MTRHRLPLAFAVAGLLACPGLLAGAVPAIAEVPSAPSAAELTYMDYHEGVFAATECRGAKFSQADYQLLEARINERAGETIHVGRQLQLIEAAKTEMGRAMSHAGCGAPEVQAALIRFDALRGYQSK